MSECSEPAAIRQESGGIQGTILANASVPMIPHCCYGKLTPASLHHWRTADVFTHNSPLVCSLLFLDNLPPFCCRFWIPAAKQFWVWRTCVHCSQVASPPDPDPVCVNWSLRVFVFFVFFLSPHFMMLNISCLGFCWFSLWRRVFAACSRWFVFVSMFKSFTCIFLVRSLSLFSSSSWHGC